MRRSLAPFNGLEASNHTPCLADFITITCGFRFLVHTGAWSSENRAPIQEGQRERYWGAASDRHQCEEDDLWCVDVKWLPVGLRAM